MIRKAVLLCGAAVGAYIWWVKRSWNPAWW